eukprot:jgi/Tetstr1/444580/TSEL_032431.t1
MALLRPARASALLLALLAACAATASGYYLPGTFPQAYDVGAKLQAEVNSVTSYTTEFSYDYYSLPFCKPVEGVKKSQRNLNIGTLLMGQKIQNSPYNFTLMKDQRNVEVCKQGYYGPLSKAEVESLTDMIKNNYRIKMILDNLPVTTQDLDDPTAENNVITGFELGYEANGDFFVNNHLVFTILVHPVDSILSENAKMFEAANLDFGGKRRHLLESGVGQTYYTVVGFEVRACSDSASPGSRAGASMVCMDSVKSGVIEGTGLKIEEGASITYTYDVVWQVSETKWASRWDAYLKMPRGQVHWFSIINSLVVALVLTGVVMIILLRTVRRDLMKYEEIVGDTEAEFKEEFGWKLVMGDVFRAPPATMHLCVQVGTGIQILLCALVTILFAALGFLSPASRGALLSTCIGMYILLSGMAGYSAVYINGMIAQSHTRWPTAAMRTSLYFPGITMLMLTVLNIMLHKTGTVGAIPLKAYFMILGLWGLVSIPLCLFGGYIASKQAISPYPVRTNQIPRQVPRQKIPGIVFSLGSGLLVFGNIFIVLYFTMTSMWQGYFYYLFGFVFFSAVLTCVITAQVSVVATYLQLCNEDYQWWWQSFYRGGAVAYFVAAYAITFMISSLNNMHGGLSIVVYLTYMGMFCYTLYILLGTVGFLASYYFTFKIFASVKSD